MTDEPTDPLDQALTDLIDALEALTDDELRTEAATLNKIALQVDLTNPRRTPYFAALSRLTAGVVHRRTDQPFQDIADHEDEDYS